MIKIINFNKLKIIADLYKKRNYQKIIINKI